MGLETEGPPMMRRFAFTLGRFLRALASERNLALCDSGTSGRNLKRTVKMLV